MSNPILSSDSDAVEQLQAKIEKAEALQARMKAVNNVIHGSPKNQSTPEKLAALEKLGIDALQAAELFRPDYAGRIGFADYQLINNGSNIRRMKERIEHVRRLQSIPVTESSNEASGIRVEDNPTDNRVRIFFPGKPDADVRTALKHHGYRWAPSLGCWQAYRNWRALEMSKTFLASLLLAILLSLGDSYGAGAQALPTKQETVTPDMAVFVCATYIKQTSQYATTFDAYLGSDGIVHTFGTALERFQFSKCIRERTPYEMGGNWTYEGGR